MSEINVINLTKKYGAQTVLDNISYTLKLGKTYLLLGVNGSGKSTFIKAILDLIKYNGVIEKPNKIKISYIPESINFPDYISIKDFLSNLAQIKKIANFENKINEMLIEWDLYEAKDKLIHHLSKGMKQKNLIINSLIHDSDLYIFDEPLNGLDFENQNLLIHKIKKLKENNKTVIITTHYVKFYTEIIDIILEIKDGKLYETVN